jgi:hypothetical protein
LCSLQAKLLKISFSRGLNTKPNPAFLLFMPAQVQARQVPVPNDTFQCFFFFSKTSA